MKQYNVMCGALLIGEIIKWGDHSYGARYLWSDVNKWTGPHRTKDAARKWIMESVITRCQIAEGVMHNIETIAVTVEPR